MVEVWSATVVAPVAACEDFVVIVRAAEGVFVVVDVEAVFEYEGVCEEAVEVGDVAAFWMALCARKAERNEPKNGRWFDMLVILFGNHCFYCRCGVGRWFELLEGLSNQRFQNQSGL